MSTFVMVSPEMSPKDAVPFLLNVAWIWIDVREKEEWEYGHLPRAKHMPLSELSPKKFSSFPKDQKMMVICRSGGRSRRMVHALREMGYLNACNFSGGMIGYNMVSQTHIPVLMH